VGNRTVTDGTFDIELPEGFTVPDNVNFGSDIMADLNGDHFYGATVTLSVQILNTTPMLTAGTLNLTSGVNITVLDFTNGHSWGGGIGADVGSVHYSGVANGRSNGTFSATLQPNAGSGASGTLTIANGSFNVRVLAP
jgi:hypothetical protein